MWAFMVLYWLLWVLWASTAGLRVGRDVAGGSSAFSSVHLLGSHGSQLSFSLSLPLRTFKVEEVSMAKRAKIASASR